MQNFLYTSWYFSKLIWKLLEKSVSKNIFLNLKIAHCIHSQRRSHKNLRFNSKHQILRATCLQSATTPHSVRIQTHGRSSFDSKKYSIFISERLTTKSRRNIELILRYGTPFGDSANRSIAQPLASKAVTSTAVVAHKTFQPQHHSTCSQNIHILQSFSNSQSHSDSTTSQPYTFGRDHAS